MYNFRVKIKEFFLRKCNIDIEILRKVKKIMVLR